MPLEEEVTLDLTSALAQIDDLGTALTAAIQAATSSASDDIATALADGGTQGAADIEAALAAINPDVAVTVGLDDASLQDAVASIDASQPTITVDDTSVAEATTNLDDLATAEQAADATITITADDSGVTDATDAVAGLGDATTAATPAAGGLSHSFEGIGAAAGVLTGQVGGLDNAVTNIVPGFGLATVGGAAFGAAIGATISTTLQADEANRRFTRNLGDQASKINDLSGVVPGLSKSLSDLSLETGSSLAGLQNFAATFQSIGQASGLTQGQINEASKQILVLANYVAATNPKLGTADEIVQRLSNSLARGGRFLAQFGLNAGSAADITAAASDKFGKPVGQLTQVEKIAAGAGLAVQNMGGQIASGIEKGTQDPVVKLRSLEQAISRIIIAGEKPLIAPLVSSLDSAAPILEAVARSFGSLAQGVLPVFGVELKIIGSALSVVADILDNRFAQAAITAAGTYIAFTKSASLFLSVVEKIGPAVTGLGEGFLSSVAGVRAHFTALQAEAAGMERVTSATVDYAAAQSDLEFVLANTTAETEAATEVGNAYAVMLERQSALADANAIASQAQIDVRDAQAASDAGAVGSQEALNTALDNFVVAAGNASAASDAYDAALLSLGGASAAAGASTDSVTAGIGALGTEVVSTATELDVATVSLTGLEVSGAGLSAVLGPIGIIAAVAAGAFALFGHKSKESSQEVDAGVKTLQKYRDSLQLTNSQLASLDTSTARSQFERVSDAAQKFFDALDQGNKEQFNAKGLNLGDVGKALDGNAAAAQRFRTALVQSGQVQFIGTKQSIQETTKAYEELGHVTKGLTISSSIAKTFDDQATAALNARKAVDAAATAELKAGDATKTGNLATLASIGGLADLGTKNETAARELLARTDATDAAAAADAAAAQATDQHSAALANQLTAVAALQNQIASGGGTTPTNPLSTQDLGNTRALAASAAYQVLDKDAKNAVDSVLKIADAQRQAAADAGHLVDANGEVTTSLTEMSQAADQAVSSFEKLEAAQGNTDAAGRQARQGLADISKAVKDYGTNTVEANASTAAGAENARQLADKLHTAAGGIRTFAEDALKNGQIKAQDFVGTLSLMGQQFIDTATKAGVPKDQIAQIAQAEGLLPDQISQNFQLSGADQATQNLQALQAGIDTLNKEPTTVVKIKPNEDAKQQFVDISNAINALPPEKRTKFLSVLDAASAAATKEGLTGVTTNDGVGYTAEINAEAKKTAEAQQKLQFAATNNGAGYQADLNVQDKGTEDSRSHINQVAQANYAAKIHVSAITDPSVDAALNKVNTLIARGQAARIQALGGPQGPGTYTGGVKLPGQPLVRGYAAGGADDKTLAALRRKLSTGTTSNPVPGLYPPGSYTPIFAEGRTGGEYFITRDPTFREGNTQVLATAAADFGYGLIPKGQAAAPIVNVKVDGAQGDPRLLAETQKQTGLLDRALSRPTMGNGNVQVDGDLTIVEGSVGDGGPDLSRAFRYVGG